MSSRFTPAELATLQGLVNFHITALARAMRHPATTPEGRLGYMRDIAISERLREKLTAETEYALRIPGEDQPHMPGARAS